MSMERKRIIGLTYDLKTDWNPRPGDPCDINAEFDPPRVIDDLAAAIETNGFLVKRIGNVKNLIQQIDGLDVDIVFNLAEGAGGRNRESQVPLILEMRGIPYIGSDALTLGITLDKVMAKKFFLAEGIPTPRFFEAGSTRGLEDLNTIGFPLIVKCRAEGSSKGLSARSRVTNHEELLRQVELITRVYKQSALVEEFIRGTEFTVAVVGNEPPEALPVVQVQIDGKTDLGDDFYTFERISSDNLRYVCPAGIPDDMARRLQELALRVYRSVECRDFGRVDFRVDEDGRPYVLEINPLPCLALEDVFSYIPRCMGQTYEQMIHRIIHCGLERNGLHNGQQKEKGQ